MGTDTSPSYVDTTPSSDKEPIFNAKITTILSQPPDDSFRNLNTIFETEQSNALVYNFALTLNEVNNDVENVIGHKIYAYDLGLRQIINLGGRVNSIILSGRWNVNDVIYQQTTSNQLLSKIASKLKDAFGDLNLIDSIRVEDGIHKGGKSKRGKRGKTKTEKKTEKPKLTKLPKRKVMVRDAKSGTSVPRQYAVYKKDGKFYYKRINKNGQAYFTEFPKSKSKK